MSASPTNETSIFRSPRRLAYAALGVACVGLAVAGAVLPGLPTTVFLVGASFLFARSCPWLEQRLIRNRFFKPYLAYLDHSAPLSTGNRITAMALMWLAVAASLAMLLARGQLTPLIGGVLVGAALVGTVVIANFRRSV